MPLLRPPSSSSPVLVSVIIISIIAIINCFFSVQWFRYIALMWDNVFFSVQWFRYKSWCEIMFFSDQLFWCKPWCEITQASPPTPPLSTPSSLARAGFLRVGGILILTNFIILTIPIESIPTMNMLMKILLRSRRRPRGSLHRWAGGDCPPGINYFSSWRIIMAVVVKIHIYCWNIQVGLVLIFPDVCWAQFFFAKRFQHLKGIGYQVWVYLVKTLKATVKQTNISKTE